MSLIEKKKIRPVPAVDRQDGQVREIERDDADLDRTHVRRRTPSVLLAFRGELYLLEDRNTALDRRAIVYPAAEPRVHRFVRRRVESGVRLGPMTPSCDLK